MIVYVAAVLVFLLYLGCVPVCAAVELTLGRETRLRLGLGIFGHARAGIWIFPLRIPKPSQKRHPPLGAFKQPVRLLFRHTQILRLEARLAAGDAFYTALISGAFMALFPRMRVQPDFSRDHFAGAAVCIVSVRLGHIMLAALYAAQILIKWRIDTWTSDRLKAS